MLLNLQISVAASIDRRKYGTARGVVARLLTRQRNYRRVVQFLNHADSDLRLATIDALQNIGDDRAIWRLLTMLQDSDPRVREHAEETLAELGATNGQLLEGYLSALISQNLHVAYDAAKRLGKLGDARAIEPLLSRLNEPVILNHSIDKGSHINLRMALEDALVQLGTTSMIMASFYQQDLASGNTYLINHAQKCLLEPTISSTKPRGRPREQRSTQSSMEPRGMQKLLLLVPFSGAGQAERRRRQAVIEKKISKLSSTDRDLPSELNSLRLLGATKEQLFQASILVFKRIRNYYGGQQHFLMEIAADLGRSRDNRAKELLLSALSDRAHHDDGVPGVIERAVLRLGAPRQLVVDAYIKGLPGRIASEITPGRAGGFIV